MYYLEIDHIKLKDMKQWDFAQEEIMASNPIASWQIEGETMEIARDFIFLGSQITTDAGCSHEIKDACFLEEKLWPT